MIDRLSLVRSGSTDSRHNLALEAVLLETAEENRMILYLWQNDNTVVIGRNQNILKECNLKNTERDGVTIVRRPSGGGAVYHDLGNLNFTMITDDRNFDIPGQTKIIMNALEKLGIQTEMSGRNDILYQGKKISGNAYQHHNGFSLHHGTLLVCSDLAKMPLYLNSDPSKLKAKGVDSIRSRVMNLKEIHEKADIQTLMRLITESCQEEFSLTAGEDFVIDEALLKQEEERFSSEAWTYGKNPPYDLVLEHRFDWGGVRMELRVREGKIDGLSVWSDAMDAEIGTRLKECLCDCVCTPSYMYEALRKYSRQQEFCDIAEWIRNQEV